MTDEPKTRLVQVTATSTSDYDVIVKVPSHITDDQVMDFYKEVGANGEFEESGSDWVWGDAVEYSPVDDEPSQHIEDMTGCFGDPDAC
jgi:hypothetical protein